MTLLSRPGLILVHGHRQLVRRFRQTPAVASAIPLVIFASDAEELTLVTNFDELGHEFADWTVAVHVAARRADSAAFCNAARDYGDSAVAFTIRRALKA